MPILTEQPCCRNCYFFDPAPDEGGVGFCLRHSPVLLPGYEDDPLQGHWPSIHSDDWCGEYMPVRVREAPEAPTG